MKQIRSMLNSEIEKTLRELDTQQSEDERSRLLKELTILHELKIQEDKVDLEYLDSKNKSLMDEFDKTVRTEQKETDVRNGYFRLGLEIAGLVVPMTFYALWMRKGFKFEETGTFTSTTFRNLFNRFRPTNNH